MPDSELKRLLQQLRQNIHDAKKHFKLKQDFMNEHGEPPYDFYADEFAETALDDYSDFDDAVIAILEHIDETEWRESRDQPPTPPAPGQLPLFDEENQS